MAAALLRKLRIDAIVVVVTGAQNLYILLCSELNRLLNGIESREVRRQVNVRIDSALIICTNQRGQRIHFGICTYSGIEIGRSAVL